MKKKLFAVAITLAAALCFSVSAFAAGSAESNTTEAKPVVTSPVTGDPTLMLSGVSAVSLAVAAYAARKSR